MNKFNIADYPIAEVVDEVKATLANGKYAVLSSPTGSGKSTVLPLVFLDEEWLHNRKIILLEPRRIAAYAVANQLARNLSCSVGETVGYRMRLDRKVSPETRIEVLTEGMLTRKIQRDPELSDTALIIFDEFHERSLQSDLALALALDAAESLRDDLRILVMSATLESSKTAYLLGDAPVIESKGRSYPVDIRYTPRRTDLSIAESTVQAVLHSLQNDSGSMLVFLPGEADIRFCEESLKKSVSSENVNIIPLYGRLDNELQRQAIEPPAAGVRKIVLATAIAESSLTIDGVQIVIDSGFTRIARYNVNTNLQRLETVPISQAASIQRAGRAGRTAPGIAYRLWSEHEQNKRELMRPGEMSYSDLTGLMLELAAWGVSDPEKLKFMEPPPEGAWTSAKKYLQSIEAVDENGVITAHGRLMHKAGLSVRASHLIAAADQIGMAQSGIKLAALLDGVDMRRNNFSNINDLLERMDTDRTFAVAKRLAQECAKRLNGVVSSKDKNNWSIGAILAYAFPDRVAKRRGSMGELRYLLAGGRAAQWYDMVNIASHEFIVALELDDKTDNAVLQLAAGVEAWEIEEILADKFTEEVNLKVSSSDLSVEAVCERKLGAILWRKIRSEAPERKLLCAALEEVIRKEGLALLDLPDSLKKLQSKTAFIHQYDPECGLPLLSEEYIIENINGLLYNFLPEKFSKNMLKNMDWHNAVYSLLDYNQQRKLSSLLPEMITLENGRDFKINYDHTPPSVEGKLQLFFGVRKQPSLFNGKLPLSVVMLSPAGRPVQTTSNIGDFWSGSYKLVRNDLKGRYPKHDWPENP